MLTGWSKLNKQLHSGGDAFSYLLPKTGVITYAGLVVSVSPVAELITTRSCLREPYYIHPQPLELTCEAVSDPLRDSGSSSTSMQSPLKVYLRIAL